MCALYPVGNAGKRLPNRRNLTGMVLWLLAALLSPAPSPSHLILGLAVVAAAVLLVVLAATGPASSAVPRTVRPAAQLVGGDDRPRQLDPDAPGRPRPRAPTAYPTAA
jgi:hypothetical protein